MLKKLIGPQTVNTLPPKTLTAFLEHGQVRPSLNEDLDAAHKAMDDLEELGISMQTVTEELETKGVKAFSDSFTELLQVIDDRKN